MLEHLTTSEIKTLLWQNTWFIEAKLELYRRGELQSHEVATYILAGYMKPNLNRRQNQPLLPKHDGTRLKEGEDISLDSVSQINMPISETLAQIYVAQGLFNEAEETYRQLCLIFPEKSAYFVSKIHQLNGNSIETNKF